MPETLIASTILIILIFIIRTAFRKKLNSRFFYALWLLPAVRLLILPIIELPQGWSLISLIKNTSRSINLFGLYTNDAEGLKVVVNIGEFLSSRAALVIWGIGMATVFLFHFVPYVRQKHKLKNHRTLIEYREVDRLKIYSSDIIASPALYGFDIYVPTGMIEEKRNFNLSVLHERCHFEQWDELWNLVRVICSSIYWFNPLVWIAVIKSRDDSEYSCDEAVTKNMSCSQKREYCKLLLEIATGGLLEQNHSFFEADMVKSPIYKRIMIILAEKKAHPFLKVLILLCLFAVLLLSLNTN